MCRDNRSYPSLAMLPKVRGWKELSLRQLSASRVTRLAAPGANDSRTQIGRGSANE